MASYKQTITDIDGNVIHPVTFTQRVIDTSTGKTLRELLDDLKQQYDDKVEELNNKA